MCRTDRRCPNQNCTHAREAHNRRRRDNRKIRKNIEQWAADQGLDLDPVKGKPADALKIWADGNGAPPEVLQPATWKAGAQPQPATPAAVQGRPVPNAHPGRGFAPAGGGAGGGKGKMPAVGGGVAPAPVHGQGNDLVIENNRISAGDRQYLEPIKDQVSALLKRQAVDQTWQERILTQGGTVLKEIGAGINTTKMVQLDSESTGYFKPFAGLEHSVSRSFGQKNAEQPIHEAAAWQLAKQLGPEYTQMVSPCIIREVGGQWGSVSFGQTGTSTHRAGIRSISELPKDQVDNLAFFDAVIRQQDRHEGNFLVDNRGIVAIDHGFSFSNNREYMNYSKIQAYRASARPELTQQEFQLLVRITGSSNCLGLKDIIGEDRAKALQTRAQNMLKTGRIPLP